MADLPAKLSDFKTAIQRAKARIGQSSAAAGKDFLRMGRSGTWEFGADSIEVEHGSKWAINPNTFAMGFIAWGDSSNVLGEVMASITDDDITREQLPPVGAEWAEQVGFELACVSGEDTGVQAVYKNTSKGCRDEFDRVLTELLTRMDAGEDKLVPIVVLESSSYKHKKFGKIHTPVFNIVDWKAMGDDVAEVEDEVEDEVEEPAPKRRRRRKAS
jgi:hypothetical protein